MRIRISILLVLLSMAPAFAAEAIPLTRPATALAVWGDAKVIDAVAAPASKKGKLLYSAIVAYGTLGKGTIVVAGITDPLSKNCPKPLANLAAQCIYDATNMQVPSVVVYRTGSLSKTLATLPSIRPKAIRKLDAKQLKGAHVLCVASIRTAAERKIIETYVQVGGNLVIFASPPSRAKPARESELNRLLAPVGIAVTATRISTKYGGGILHAASSELDEPAEMRLDKAFAALDAPAPKPVRRKRGEKKPVVVWESARTQAIKTIQAASSAIPAESKFAKALCKIASAAWTIVPPKNARDPKAVSIEKNPRDYLAVTLLGAQLATMPVDKIKAHPAAAAYPGAVAASAKRITKTIEIDLATPRWHTTGLYAAPGDVISVKTPAAALGKKLKIRIGAHKDNNLRHPVLQRFPHLTRSFALTAATTQAACSFGGTVYIEVPRGATGTTSVTISGAVEQPVFRRGMTDAAWKYELQKPAPWAELCGDKVILIVPTEMAKTVTKPEELMERWDRFLDLCAKVSGNDPAARTSPERLTGCLQISVGYLHSGYPAMGQYKHNLDLVDNDALSKKVPWGWYHELGHNHQNRDWTLTNGGEVTCNLFPLAGYNLLLKRPVSDNKRFGSKLGPGLKKYFSKTPTYKDFTSDVWLGLVFYYQIIEEFGWENWFAVAKTYRELPKDQRPKTDQQKRDMLLTIYSKQVKRNLAPQFVAWGVEPSKAACDAVKRYPAWIHPDVKKYVKK